MVDALAKDGYALLLLLDGKQLGEPVGQAALLLATVLGQDLEQVGGWSGFASLGASQETW